VTDLVAEGLLSYSMPQGVRRGAEVDLSDRTYDGREESGYLSGGLGQLVDGQKGQDIFRLDLKGHGKGTVQCFLFLPTNFAFFHVVSALEIFVCGWVRLCVCITGPIVRPQMLHD
jgi:hypothetical protein